MIAGNIAISGANIQPTDFKFASRHWTDLVQERFVQTNYLAIYGMHLGIAKICFNKIYKSIKNHLLARLPIGILLLVLPSYLLAGGLPGILR